MKKCINCNNLASEDALFCPKCGNKELVATNNQQQVVSNNQQNNFNNSGIRCPKCSSANISIQMFNESQLVTKHHGCLWWIIIGWWWIFVKWIVLFVPALLAKIFIGSRKKIKNTTKKMAVCQNCGNSWNI